MGQLLRQFWRQVVLLSRTPVLLRVCCGSSHLSPLLPSDALQAAPALCEPSLSLWQVSATMLIASDACLPRIGTLRSRPNAPRAARSHTLCERSPLQQATERRPGDCLSPPPFPTGIQTSPAAIRASLASSSAAAAATRGPKAAAAAMARRWRRCARLRARRAFSSERGASAARTARAAGAQHASSSDGT